MQPRVGQHKLGRLETTTGIVEQIEVELPGRIVDAGPTPACARFNTEELRKQVLGSNVRAQSRSRVHVRGLIHRSTHWGGLIHVRHGDDFEHGIVSKTAQGELQVAEPISEVRSERDVTVGFGVADLGGHRGKSTRYTGEMAAPQTYPPEARSEIPGPRSRALASRLARTETSDVTCLDPLPIFWERAAGANVWDVDGNRFVDLSAAFGVANTGHGHPRVIAAVSEQAGALLHGMGDVYPSAVKVELLEALARRYPGGAAARVTLVSSGADAVETALKTASLATGRDGVIAFEGSYHGVSLGTLAVTHPERFRAPFIGRLPETTSFARYGDPADVLRATEACPTPVGAVLVEPVLGRGGEVVPPRGFLRELRSLCDERGYLLIADEVYTGFGRTGAWFACEHEDVVPDLMCVGKGLSGGMPISACLGLEQVMDAWPVSQGEALHTQTFLGHPPSCAAALANMAVIEEENLPERAARIGEDAIAFLTDTLGGHSSVREVRGLGLMIGIEFARSERCIETCRAALERGVITLPSGPLGSVLSITPALNIEREVFLASLKILCEVIQ